MRLGINHVDPRPLQKFQLLFGGTLVQKSSKGNRHLRWQWKLTCNQAKEFILKVRPYLVNKDIVADIALQFLTTITPGKKTRLSEEVVKFRQDCSARLRLVNSQS